MGGNKKSNRLTKRQSKFSISVTHFGKRKQVFLFIPLSQWLQKNEYTWDTLS